MKITVRKNNQTVLLRYDAPVLLADAVADAGFFMAKPCGGRGSCGKCTIRAQGVLSECSETEKKVLSPLMLQEGFRLACQTKALGDAELLLEEEGRMEGLAAGAAKRSLPGGQTGTGLAFDIGTTTVAASLITLHDGKEKATLCEWNRQASFGADVVSRIEYSNRGGKEELAACLQAQLHDMTELLCGSEKPTSLVITGNTAMLHFYKGLSTAKMAVVPFTPDSLFGFAEDTVYFPPCVSAFVGADITCAALYAGLPAQKNAFLVDIGTNGEMVAVRNGRVSCCSTAAGPVFEGAGIQAGMPAVPGAIDKVFIVNGGLAYTTIGNVPARGLCGSGLLDAVACLLVLGEIDETGHMPAPCFIGDSGVLLTPADIREVQLAKSAIRSGIDILLEDAQPDVFFIAGGFGSRLNLASAVRIGLLPSMVPKKAVVLGNAALGGAQMLLADPAQRAVLAAYAKTIQTVPLAGTAVFSEKYIDNMFFPEE